MPEVEGFVFSEVIGVYEIVHSLEVFDIPSHDSLDIIKKSGEVSILDIISLAIWYVRVFHGYWIGLYLDIRSSTSWRDLGYHG